MTAYHLWEEEMESNPQVEMEIDLLLEGIFQLSGYDFRGYAKSSITRRVLNRMKIDNIPTVTRVLDKAFHEKGFLQQLLNDFSINVTEMFRDPEFFRALREQVLPELAKLPEIRIWHAGCSSGEEVFSMAILLKEAGLYERSVMFATDFNDNILKRARQGMFPLAKMQAYTKNYISAGGMRAFSEYYTADRNAAYIDPALMENMIFWQHNLVTDYTFNEFDLVICRNVLIYFSSELQAKVQKLFYNSLSDGGFLGLGDKETLRFTTISNAYEDFNEQNRIYRKKTQLL
ncbi:protein-glutamate O-methyltransferase CheR [Aciduricibacillus chroicocephali]|uniref:Protein-glutamate O-methyltransferase CheR n=1 Tax=Aciduricibacillus chroicocephali TaxID=3054939 RepID=A0ABY9KT57_9BACI|nr:protein-glutamate O-methyltransferase CheR [Bacillaceae bacterium 44XB]